MQQKKAACGPQEGMRSAVLMTEDRGTWATRSQMPKAAEQGENICLGVPAPPLHLHHSLHQPWGNQFCFYIVHSNLQRVTRSLQGLSEKMWCNIFKWCLQEQLMGDIGTVGVGIVSGWHRKSSATNVSSSQRGLNLSGKTRSGRDRVPVNRL